MYELITIFISYALTLTVAHINFQHLKYQPSTKAPVKPLNHIILHNKSYSIPVFFTKTLNLLLTPIIISIISSQNPHKSSSKTLPTQKPSHLNKSLVFHSHPFIVNI